VAVALGHGQMRHPRAVLEEIRGHRRWRWIEGHERRGDGLGPGAVAVEPPRRPARCGQAVGGEKGDERRARGGDAGVARPAGHPPVLRGDDPHRRASPREQNRGRASPRVRDDDLERLVLGEQRVDRREYGVLVADESTMTQSSGAAIVGGHSTRRRLRPHRVGQSARPVSPRTGGAASGRGMATPHLRPFEGGVDALGGASPPPLRLSSHGVRASVSRRDPEEPEGEAA